MAVRFGYRCKNEQQKESLNLPIKILEDARSRHISLQIDGHFTFDIYREFLDAVDSFAARAKHVTVDLRHSGYMDSAALGLLIQMRGKLNDVAATLRVSKGSVIDEVLTVANFGHLFVIEAT